MYDEPNLTLAEMAISAGMWPFIAYKRDAIVEVLIDGSSLNEFFADVKLRV